jgi:hypothetical protein
MHAPASPQNTKVIEVSFFKHDVQPPESGASEQTVRHASRSQSSIPAHGREDFLEYVIRSDAASCWSR